jgi:chemotaxis protein MotB
MARNRISTLVPKANHDRWLLSYADFITLLFALFVVLFAASQSDKSRIGAIRTSYMQAVQKGASFKGNPVVTKVLGGTIDDVGAGNAMRKGPGGAKAASIEINRAVPLELLPALQPLTQELSKEIADGSLQLHMDARGLVISFAQTALFGSGDDRVQSESIPVFGRIAKVLASIPNDILVEGHTDPVPINNSKFHSNWELSAARSIAVMNLLIHRFGIPARRVAITGYADNKLLEGDDSEAGRSRNRRVDLVIQNVTIAASEGLAAHAQSAATAR